MIAYIRVNTLKFSIKSIDVSKAFKEIRISNVINKYTFDGENGELEQNFMN